MNYFYYWLKNVETKEEDRIGGVDLFLGDIGEIVEIAGEKFEIVDYAMERMERVERDLCLSRDEFF